MPLQNDRFLPTLQEYIDSHEEKQVKGALLMVEIMNFPIILSIYGRDFSSKCTDTILLQLKKLLKNEDKICQIDRTKIAIIMNNCEDEDIRHMAEQVYRSIRTFGSTIEPDPLHVVASLGSCAFPLNKEKAEDIFDKTYIALKQSTQGYHRHYADYHEVEKQQGFHRNQMILAHSIHNALLNKRLRLAFQPIINSKTGVISHHECLLRIINDDGRIISVGQFIPIVEKMGFIDMVDELVLEMVVEELRESPAVSLAFNISGIGIDNAEWMKKAKKLFSDPEIAARAVVEITETALQKDMIQASYFISSLQDMGCQVAIDDFGAGHTSFRQLKNLPVDIIKIDGSFIRDIVDNSDNRLFVRTLIDITKGFGLKAIAEFVENGEIAKMLMELKVDYMQGNYFCPAVNYRSWVQENAAV